MPRHQIGSWTIRRRLVFAGLGFCAGVIGYCLWRGTDSELYRVAVTNSFLTASAIYGAYVFGATWDDKNARDAANEEPGQ